MIILYLNLYWFIKIDIFILIIHIGFGKYRWYNYDYIIFKFILIYKLEKKINIYFDFFSKIYSKII